MASDQGPADEDEQDDDEASAGDAHPQPHIHGGLGCQGERHRKAPDIKFGFNGAHIIPTHPKQPACTWRSSSLMGHSLIQ